MEQNFKSSFIPKKNVSIATNGVRHASGSMRKGMLDTIAGFVFALTLIAWGGLFGYQKYVEASITDVEKEVVDARSRIDNERLDQFRSLGKQVKISKEILNQHIIATPVFDLLERLTAQSVQFTDFALSLEDDGLRVVSSASAKNFASVELQAQALRDSGELIGVSVFDVALSAESGNVIFEVSFLVPRERVLYTQVVQKAIEESVAQQALENAQNTQNTNATSQDGGSALTNTTSSQTGGGGLDDDIIDQILNDDDLDSLLQKELESL